MEEGPVNSQGSKNIAGKKETDGNALMCGKKEGENEVQMIGVEGSAVEQSEDN